MASQKQQVSVLACFGVAGRICTGDAKTGGQSHGKIQSSRPHRLSGKQTSTKQQLGSSDEEKVCLDFRGGEAFELGYWSVANSFNIL